MHSKHGCSTTVNMTQVSTNIEREIGLQEEEEVPEVKVQTFLFPNKTLNLADQL